MGYTTADPKPWQAVKRLPRVGKPHRDMVLDVIAGDNGLTHEFRLRNPHAAPALEDSLASDVADAAQTQRYVRVFSPGDRQTATRVWFSPEAFASFAALHAARREDHRKPLLTYTGPDAPPALTPDGVRVLARSYQLTDGTDGKPYVVEEQPKSTLGSDLEFRLARRALHLQQNPLHATYIDSESVVRSVYLTPEAFNAFAELDTRREPADALLDRFSLRDGVVGLTDVGYSLLHEVSDIRTQRIGAGNSIDVVSTLYAPRPRVALQRSTLLETNLFDAPVFHVEGGMDADRAIKGDLPVPPVLGPNADATHLYPSHREFGAKLR